MHRTSPEALREDVRPVLQARISEQQLAKLLPVEMDDLDPLSAPEPARGALIELESRSLVFATYGLETGELLLQVPESKPLASALKAILEEVPLDAEDIIWRADRTEEADGSLDDLKREKKVIKKFAERLHCLHRIPVDIIAWPDEEQPGQGYWDATLQRDGQVWILDHTQFGSFEEHFRDDAFFKDVLEPLETELPEHFPEVYIWVSIDVGSIPKGNRAAMHESLLKALIDEIPGMPDDEHIEHMKPYTLPDVPFTVYVSKTTEESPGCHVGRVLPSDQQEQLIAGLAETLRKKQEQFTRFRSQQDSPTVLLLDTDDFASLNVDTVRKAFRPAQERVDTSSIDEVYLFYHRGGEMGNFLIFPLKNSAHSIPDETEWGDYKRAQRVITWGRKDWGPPHLTC